MDKLFECRAHTHLIYHLYQYRNLRVVHAKVMLNCHQISETDYTEDEIHPYAHTKKSQRSLNTIK